DIAQEPAESGRQHGLAQRDQRVLDLEGKKRCQQEEEPQAPVENTACAKRQPHSRRRQQGVEVEQAHDQEGRRAPDEGNGELRAHQNREARLAGAEGSTILRTLWTCASRKIST